jgi:TetR/AcrR family transcriptional regulator
MVKPKGSTKRSTRAGPRPRPDQETRDRILAAAHRVFTRKGTASGRTQEIAREAGVNKALVHYYFGTKAALADAIFARALGALVPRIFGILADPDRSVEQKVPAIVKEQIDFHSARPYLAGYMIAELHAHPERIARMMTAHGRIPLDVLRRQLQEGARAGKFRRIGPEQFVANMMGLLLFPFAVRAALCELLDLDSARWQSFLEERRRILPDFVMAGLRP